MLLKTLLNCVILHSCLSTKTYKNPALKIIFLFGIPKRESSNSGFSRVTPFLKTYFWVGCCSVLKIWMLLISPECSLEGLMLKLKLQYFGHLMQKSDSFERTLMLEIEKDWKQEEKGTTEDEMVGWHHRLNGHGFGWTPGVGDGQGGLGCCSSRGHKELDTTEQLNWTELSKTLFSFKHITLKFINSFFPLLSQHYTLATF